MPRTTLSRWMYLFSFDKTLVNLFGSSFLIFYLKLDIRQLPIQNAVDNMGNISYRYQYFIFIPCFPSHIVFWLRCPFCSVYLPLSFSPQGFHTRFFCLEQWPKVITWLTLFPLSDDGIKVISAEIHTTYVTTPCPSQISFILIYYLNNTIISDHLVSIFSATHYLAPSTYLCLAFK